MSVKLWPAIPCAEFISEDVEPRKALLPFSLPFLLPLHPMAFRGNSGNVVYLTSEIDCGSRFSANAHVLRRIEWHSSEKFPNYAIVITHIYVTIKKKYDIAKDWKLRFRFVYNKNVISIVILSLNVNLIPRRYYSFRSASSFCVIICQKCDVLVQCLSAVEHELKINIGNTNKIKLNLWHLQNLHWYISLKNC